MKRFVIGDIHGGHRALLQCFKRSNFNSKRDLLISLGDVCDGWPEVNLVINELVKIKNFKLIMGNHDQWTLNWIQFGWEEHIWTSQGGKETQKSYQYNRNNVPQPHLKLLQNAIPYLELENKLFVHGGINPGISLKKQGPDLMMWDRDLLSDAVRVHKSNPAHRYGKWDDIFLGHTTTQFYRTLKPLHACNVWDLDTGGGWSGKLTIMNFDTYEYWQSDLVPDLYPQISGRI